MQFRITGIYPTIMALGVWLQLQQRAMASSSSNTFDASIYGMNMQRDWLYENTVINLKYEGCVWGNVNSDMRENLACMDDESEDGTTYWYMMANCRRAQVAYSLYAASSGTSCKSSQWKESLVTTGGIAEFAYVMGKYSYYNAPISEDTVGYSACEAGDDGYYGLGCSTSGTFVLDRFSDQYCTQKLDTYDTLSNLNYAMKSLSCYQMYNANDGSSAPGNLLGAVMDESATCSTSESTLCKTSSFVLNSGSNSIGQRTTSKFTSGNASFTNSLKYGLGTTMLVGSVIMFFGILFTNRKKRRAMMHRKFKSSSEKKKKRSSRSHASKKKSSSKKSSGIFA